MCNAYRILDHNQYYIDKTGILEKGITAFPSIYIEGAAACGKTTAVQMLLSRHPETVCTVFDMKKYQSKESLFCQELSGYSDNMSCKTHWVIFENLHMESSKPMAEAMADFVRQLPQNGRALFISRERPPEAFLDLFWKHQMTFCKQQGLLFDREEVEEYVRQTGCRISAEEIYTKTGGWAGCVSMLVSLSLSESVEKKEESKGKIAEEYIRSYEMQTYIRREILDTLGFWEKEMIQKAGRFPWMNEKLCSEVWKMKNSSDTMDSLMRKGLLLCDGGSGRWELAPILRFCKLGEDQEAFETDDDTPLREGIPAKFWERSGRWYDENGYLWEALYCLKKMDDSGSYRKCMIKHFSEIPFSDIDFKEVMTWQEDMPQICYLRGVYSYMHRNFSGLEREIKRLEEMYLDERMSEKREICREIYINLCYLFPDMTLDEWLALVEEKEESGGRIRLYCAAGNSPMALCALRDLSGLFACSLKEERRKEKIWKNHLDFEAWKFYQMARMDYYMETLRSEAIGSKDREELFSDTKGQESWRIGLARFYLLCKYQKIHPDERNLIYIDKWMKKLASQNNDTCKSIAKAISSFCELEQTKGQTLNQWLRYSAKEPYPDISEDNFSVLYFRAKGYILVNQYDKAKRLLRLLIPYAKGLKRDRLTGELFFQEAIVSLAEGSQGQALRSAIESFLLCGSSRYVYFYTGYGKKGLEVIELYIDWLRSNEPEGWHRKKKYNYGNVVRMPMEDYLDVILRRTRRELRIYPKPHETEGAEKLTMMETMVLQELGRGMTNADICRSLNLKMTTVKSHVYSIYKKLGVSSRVQAVLKGKESGIIR